MPRLSNLGPVSPIYKTKPDKFNSDVNPKKNCEFLSSFSMCVAVFYYYPKLIYNPRLKNIYKYIKICLTCVC